MPADVVFTVEYSVRPARVAVYQLLKLDKQPPAINKGAFDPTVFLDAVKARHRSPRYASSSALSISFISPGL